MKKSRDNYTFLTHAPVHRVIFTMAIPTIISMLSTSMYNLADTYFVGSINTQSVAAVGVSFAMMAVIQAVGFFYGHGAGNYISRMLGAKEVEKAKKMAATGFILSFLTGLLIAILGQLFLTPLCVLLGSTPTIQPYTERYLGIILLGAPFMTTSLTLNNLMRFQGNTMYAMKGIMSGVLLNLILAPLLILYFAMGITGAAIATLISQCFGCAMLFWMSHKGQNIRIHLHNFTPTRAYIKEIIFGGTPSLSRQGLGSIATLVLNVAAGAYGDAASHCGYEYRDENLVLHLCRGHRTGSGFPAALRFLLWSQAVRPREGGFLFLHQMRHGISGGLCRFRLPFLRAYHRTLP